MAGSIRAGFLVSGCCTGWIFWELNTLRAGYLRVEWERDALRAASILWGLDTWGLDGLRYIEECIPWELDALRVGYLEGWMPQVVHWGWCIWGWMSVLSALELDVWLAGFDAFGAWCFEGWMIWRLDGLLMPLSTGRTTFGLDALVAGCLGS